MSRCDCKNIELGSYDNQVVLIPWWKDTPIGIDNCLKDEILSLWEKRIMTTGCCCGHNKVDAYITVRRKDHIKMEKLGYVSWKNIHGHSCYEPKSIKNNHLKRKEMTLNEYQGAALETAQYPKEHRIIYPVLGLNGEAGEVADKVKKVLRDEKGKITPSKKEELVRELGDVLWYVAVLAHDLDHSLEEVGQMNVEKLKSRKERNMISGSGDNR